MALLISQLGGGGAQTITGNSLDVPVLFGDGSLSIHEPVIPIVLGGFGGGRRKAAAQKLTGDSIRIPVQFGTGQLQFIIRARGIGGTTSSGRGKLNQNLYGFGSTRPTLTGPRGSIDLAKAQLLGGIGHRVRMNVGAHNLKPINPEHDDELGILLSLME